MNEKKDYRPAAVSGGGWMKTVYSKDTKEYYSEPIVAWVVETKRVEYGVVEGSGFPLITDSDGLLTEIDDQEFLVWHPDQVGYANSHESAVSVLKQWRKERLASE